MTSVNATIYYLKKHYSGKKVYVLGTQSLKKAVGCAGFKIAKGADDDADLLLMGFDTELTFQKLDDASRLLTRLEAQGLIQRSMGTKDARMKRITPTLRAQTLNEEAEQRIAATEALLTRGISREEIDSFLATAEKLKRNLI